MSLITNIHADHFKYFKKGYGDCVKFTEHFEKNKFSKEGVEKLRSDCDKFFSENFMLIKEAVKSEDYTYASAGRDYWLTRNGHGAGYWDRDLGEVGDQLTKASEYNECHAFLIKKKIHLEG
jgi:hypothetical protein